MKTKYYDIIESGKRIRALRKEAKVRQEDLAAALKINTVTLSRIEQGHNGASLDLLIEIANYFHASLDYIILGENDSKEIKRRFEQIANMLKELENDVT